jgi:chromate transporter
MTLWLLFLAVLKSSALSFSGGAAFPILEADVVGRYRWLNPAGFAAAIGLGSVSPGPTGYGSLAVGYYVAGWPGAIVAALAVMLPPMTILVLLPLRRRLGGLRGAREAAQGVAAASVGLLLLLGLGLWHQSDRPVVTAIAAALTFIASLKRVSPPLLVALGALAGVVLRG